MTKSDTQKKPMVARFLDFIEWLGNKLPDPAILFVIAMLIVWLLSWMLAGVEFTEINPRTGQPIRIINQLSGTALADFLATMVTTFTSFPPLGVVLVAMLGVGVAEHSGYINAGLKIMLSFTPKFLLTPALILVAIVSHTATDAGYVLVIPLGGVIFYAAGRHPLAGIAAAFAGVSGGFSANFIPSGIDPLLQGFTESAAQIINSDYHVNALCNWFFTGASSILIVLVGWYLTDKVIEPRLADTPVDGDPDEMPVMEELDDRDRKAFWIATVSMIIGLIVLIASMAPSDSPLRSPDGSLTNFSAPVMKAIVPLIFVLFLLPGLVHGYIAGTFKTSKDTVQAMSKSMGTMAYYIVMAFFCALFIAAFGKSNLGALLAIKGANVLAELSLPGQVTIVGIILLTAAVNLVIGSASAKWALLSAIFVPMLMQLGFSPELVQAAYRVGDSSSNIVTPLMPYFPLVVVFCQRYVKDTGIGTLVSLMIPYSIAFLICWSIFLIAYWALGLPMGLQAPYVYPAP